MPAARAPQLLRDMRVVLKGGEVPERLEPLRRSYGVDPGKFMASMSRMEAAESVRKRALAMRVSAKEARAVTAGVPVVAAAAVVGVVEESLVGDAGQDAALALIDKLVGEMKAEFNREGLS